MGQSLLPGIDLSASSPTQSHPHVNSSYLKCQFPSPQGRPHVTAHRILPLGMDLANDSVPSSISSVSGQAQSPSPQSSHPHTPSTMKRKLQDLSNPDSRRASPTLRTSTPTPSASTPRPRSFPSNASIALIGLRGVGKSTIGVIASSALRRRLIDADMHFVTVTGMVAAQYATLHGWPAYRAKEAEILADILRENETGAVIVCSSGCVEKSTSRALLWGWMARHPVVHIVRHEKEIEAYLRPGSPGESSPLTQMGSSAHVLRRLAARREPLYTVYSNFEFYNMWDKRQLPTTTSGKSEPSSPTLKKVEQDFLRLLNFVFQQEMAPLIVWDCHSPHPSSPAAATTLEDRMYTYALIIPPTPTFGPIDSAPLDLEDVGATSEAFDLRIDYLLHSRKLVGVVGNDSRFVSEQFAYVRRCASLPIIYNVGTEHQGGCFPAHPGDGREDDYFVLLYHGIRLGADYLVVDLRHSDQRIRDLVASKGGTKIIGSYFETREGAEWSWDGAERRRIYDRAARLGCDLVQLSQKATTLGDNFAAIAFAWDVKRRRDTENNTKDRPLPSLIAVNTGKLGKMSRYMNRVLSPVTHTLLQEASTSPASDEITSREALVAIHACSMLPRLHFCVFGSTITNSLSPAMHNAAYEAYGVPHHYSIQQAESINDLLHIVQDPNFGGASIALPFKLEIIPLLHSISDHARAIGAVNTIVPIRSHGGEGAQAALHGDNTDWIGIRTCTLRYLTPVNAITARTSALVVGAGGMARAAIYALQKLGVENIFVYGRNVNRVAELAQYFNGRSRSRSLAIPSSTSPGASPSGDRSTSISGSNCVVRVIPSLDSHWPEDFWLPSIIVSCIPAHSIQGMPPANFTVPEQWLRSPTGGVCVEVCILPYLLR